MSDFDYFSKFFTYNKETGEIRWRVAIHRANHKAGDIAGTSDNNGYRILRIDGRGFKAHRVAWLLTYGVWPKSILDHINKITSDNRIENLREVTYSQNQSNSRKFKGVYEGRASFYSQITHDGKKIYLGSFATKELAKLAYEAKYKELKNDHLR